MQEMEKWCPLGLRQTNTEKKMYNVQLKDNDVKDYPVTGMDANSL